MVTNVVSNVVTAVIPNQATSDAEARLAEVEAERERDREWKLGLQRQAEQLSAERERGVAEYETAKIRYEAKRKELANKIEAMNRAAFRNYAEIDKLERERRDLPMPQPPR